jgi:hypothetical protein
MLLFIFYECFNFAHKNCISFFGHLIFECAFYFVCCDYNVGLGCSSSPSTDHFRPVFFVTFIEHVNASMDFSNLSVVGILFKSLSE